MRNPKPIYWILGLTATAGIVYLLVRPKTAQAATLPALPVAPGPGPTTPQPLPQSAPPDDDGILTGILPPGFKFDLSHVGPDPFTPIPWDRSKPTG